MSRGAHSHRLAVTRWTLTVTLALLQFAPAGHGQTSAAPNKSRSSATTAATPKKTAPTSAAASKAAPVASKAGGGLVHKSAAYWSGYRSSVIHQVFDGAFSGASMDGNVLFHILFSRYVEQFSNNCTAYLPRPFDKRTITHHYNNAPDTTSEINIDYRFLPKYDEYSRGGIPIGAAINLMTGATTFNTYVDPEFDVHTFFATEKCGSAAMRQLGENLLRGANGQPSLQASGGSIAGAAAESEADTPVKPASQPVAASRLGAFGEGCNAFMHDPKTSRYAPSDPDAYCKCLSDRYRTVMTPEEQVDYGKNFEAKFWGGIAQPRSDDPAWPRLNPVAVSCMQ